MPAFNVVQRRRRAAIAENKRDKHGDPVTRKLKQRSQTISLSGKRKRKLFKKWRRDQKDAIAKGLITMEDVEMAVAEGASETVNKAPLPLAFSVKKSLTVKPKRSGKKGRKGKPEKPAQEAAVDAMEFE